MTRKTEIEVIMGVFGLPPDDGTKLKIPKTAVYDLAMCLTKLKCDAYIPQHGFLREGTLTGERLFGERAKSGSKTGGIQNALDYTAAYRLLHTMLLQKEAAQRKAISRLPDKPFNLKAYTTAVYDITRDTMGWNLYGYFSTFSLFYMGYGAVMNIEDCPTSGVLIGLKNHDYANYTGPKLEPGEERLAIRLSKNEPLILVP